MVRRSFFLAILVALFAMSGCGPNYSAYDSRPSVSLDVSVEPERRADFHDGLNSFASAHGYRIYGAPLSTEPYHWSYSLVRESNLVTVVTFSSEGAGDGPSTIVSFFPRKGTTAGSEIAEAEDAFVQMVGQPKFGATVTARNQRSEN